MFVAGYLTAWMAYVNITSLRLEKLFARDQEYQLRDCAKTVDDVSKSLYKYPNVVGMGASLKFKNGRIQNIPCIVVYVDKKIPDIKEGRIPEKVGGWPTDVVQAGIPQRRSYPGPITPLQPGYSIGHHKISYGTLGCLVKDRKTSETLLLSNNHVLANMNDADKGDDIMHPGPYFDELGPTKVGELERWAEIRSLPEKNTADAALAKPLVDVTPEIPEIGIPKGVDTVRGIRRVEKTGATTGHTESIAITYNASISDQERQQPTLYPEVGFTEINHCIVTMGMSSGGDSGSLLVDKQTKKAVGLLFAGIGPPSGDLDLVTYFNDITTVLNHPDIQADLITE